MNEDCEKYIDYYSDYIEDELSLEINELFKAHLINCSYCANEIKEIKLGMDALKILKVNVVSEDIFLDIEKRESLDKKQQIIKLVIPWVLAAAFFIASLSFLITSKVEPVEKPLSSIVEIKSNHVDDIKGQVSNMIDPSDDANVIEVIDKNEPIIFNDEIVSGIAKEKITNKVYLKSGHVVSQKEISDKFLKANDYISSKDGWISADTNHELNSLRNKILAFENEILNLRNKNGENVKEKKVDAAGDLVVGENNKSRWKISSLKDLNLNDVDAMMKANNFKDTKEIRRWVHQPKRSNLQKRASLHRITSKPKIIKSKAGQLGWCIQIVSNQKSIPFVGAPLVLHNNIYVPSGKNGKLFFSINRETGKTNWVRKMYNSGGSNPVVLDNKILTTTRSGLLYKFELNDGRNKVMSLLGSNGHLLSKGRVEEKSIVLQWVNINAVGVMSAIDVKEREVLWTTNERYKPLFNILQNNNFAYYTNMIGELVKIDLLKKKVVWRLDKLFVSNPILFQNKLYVLQMRQQEKKIGNNFFPMSIFGRVLIEVDPEYGLISSDPIGAVQRYDDQLPENIFSFSGRKTDENSDSPAIQAQGLLISKENIIAVSTSKYVQFIDVSAKKDLWYHSYKHEKNIPKGVDLPVFPCIDNNRVVLFEKGGDFSIKNLKTGADIERGHLNDMFGNTRYQSILIYPTFPVIHKGWLYITSLTGNLYGLHID